MILEAAVEALSNLPLCGPKAPFYAYNSLGLERGVIIQKISKDHGLPK